MRYMMRSPVSLKRLCFTPGSKEVVYERRKGHDAAGLVEDERIEVCVLVHCVWTQLSPSCSTASGRCVSGDLDGLTNGQHWARRLDGPRKKS